LWMVILMFVWMYVRKHGCDFGGRWQYGSHVHPGDLFAGLHDRSLQERDSLSLCYRPTSHWAINRGMRSGLCSWIFPDIVIAGFVWNNVSVARLIRFVPMFRVIM
jgi:hypothetical protein